MERRGNNFPIKSPDVKGLLSKISRIPFSSKEREVEQPQRIKPPREVISSGLIELRKKLIEDNEYIMAEIEEARENDKMPRKGIERVLHGVGGLFRRDGNCKKDLLIIEKNTRTIEAINRGDEETARDYVAVFIDKGLQIIATERFAAEDDMQEDLLSVVQEDIDLLRKFDPVQAEEFQGRFDKMLV